MLQGNGSCFNSDKPGVHCSSVLVDMVAEIYCYFHAVTETQDADVKIMVRQSFGAHGSIVIDEVGATGGGLPLQCLVEVML